MKSPTILTLALSMCLPFLAAPASAQEPAGKDLYAMYCTQCHGTQGNGKGLNAARMSVQPRSHIDRAEMIARTDEELFKVIEQGGGSIDKSILMPAWGGNLSKENIEQLVQHLRVLCCGEQ